MNSVPTEKEKIASIKQQLMAIKLAMKQGRKYDSMMLLDELIYELNNTLQTEWWEVKGKG